jgi:hypothetical protein
MIRAAIIDSTGRVRELADQARARWVAAAENVVQVIKKRRGGDIWRIELASYTDDNLRKPSEGNSQALSHDYETATNPRRVWELQRLGSRHPDADAYIRAAYRRT